MTNSFIEDLGYLSYTMRLKRLSDNIIHSGRRLYADLNLDIEPNWFLIFKILDQRDNLSVTEISEVIGLSHPSVIAIINKMTERGFVEAQLDTKDARRKVLTLTDKAVKNLPKYESVWQNGTEAMTSALQHLDALKHLEKLEAVFASGDFRRRVLLERAQSVRIDHSERHQFSDFEKLNLEWIEKFFYVEDTDREVLGNPRSYILDNGGFIFNATLDDQVIGTVALIKRKENVFELSKMAVTEKFQGLKIGKRLIEHCVSFTKSTGVHTLYLDSNTKLKPAISLYRKMGFVEVPYPDDTPYERSNIRMVMEL
jgi:DNA-binding MarR family transcriptional regulator/GNAT superfamily N-acetyltransferase